MALSPVRAAPPENVDEIASRLLIRGGRVTPSATEASLRQLTSPPRAGPAESVTAFDGHRVAALPPGRLVVGFCAVVREPSPTPTNRCRRWIRADLGAAVEPRWGLRGHWRRLFPSARLASLAGWTGSCGALPGCRSLDLASRACYDAERLDRTAWPHASTRRREAALASLACPLRAKPGPPAPALEANGSPTRADNPRLILTKFRRRQVHSLARRPTRAADSSDSGTNLSTRGSVGWRACSAGVVVSRPQGGRLRRRRRGGPALLAGVCRPRQRARSRAASGAVGGACGLLQLDSVNARCGASTCRGHLFGWVPVPLLD